MTLSRRVAVVTGAGSGIGRASALSLLKNGYSVVLTGRNEANLKETADMAENTGESLIVIADVSCPDSVKTLFRTVFEKFGHLNVVFNNAGVSAPSIDLEKISVTDWQRCVDVNLTGVFLCTQEAFRLMKTQVPMGGRIINNGSISAAVPRPNSSPYTATKHAITGLTRSTSLDGRKYNIACGQIDIGNAYTPMTEVMHEGVPQANGTIAAEPTMNVEDVANAVLFMANLSLDSNVQFMTIMATKMPFIGRG